jgi:putative salt-induced outer membrane protein YdiY
VRCDLGRLTILFGCRGIAGNLFRELTVLTALITTLALAATPDTGKHVFFTGDAGVVATSGNTSVTSIDVGNKLVIASAGWKFTEAAGLTYAKTHDSVTAELWHGVLRGDRTVARHIALYVLTEFERNTFAGIRSRMSPSFGVSALAIATPRDTLRTELGGGYTVETAVPPGLDRRYAAGRIAAVFHHQLGQKSAFDEAVEYLPNFQTSADYRITSATSVTAPLATGIAMKAAYLIRYEGLPQPGFVKTDRTLTMGIQVTL